MHGKKEGKPNPFAKAGKSDKAADKKKAGAKKPNPFMAMMAMKKK